MTWATVCISLVAVVVASRFLIVAKASNDIGRLPGLWSLFPSFSVVGAIVPTMPLNAGLSWTWLWRSSVYRQLGSDTISIVPLAWGFTSIYTRSAEVTRQVLGGKPQYWKAPESLANFLLWGDNILTANYDNYKRHRRIVAPGFRANTYRLVWQETSKTYYEMLDAEGWTLRKSFSLSSVNPFMSKIALTIIARCGFGLPFPWQKSQETKQSLQMAFDDALSIVSRTALTRLAAPNWMYKLPIKFLRDVDEAYRVLARYMTSFASARKVEMAGDTSAADVGNNSDLFTCLVRANEEEGKIRLSDEELIGNIFTFMFAGHETTAVVLSATLGLLALYPKEQDDVLQQIRQVLSDNRDPVFEDMTSLRKVAACFHEAARLFPPASLLTRDTTENVILSVDQLDGTQKLVTVPPGVRMIIDMIGLNYNPRLFDNPEEFRPSRWYNKPDGDPDFFGFGPRSCIGKKFATAEVVCMLTMILRDWKVEPLFEPGETSEMWRERGLSAKLIGGQAFGVAAVPLNFTRRA